jgi:hypothetical protein
MNSLIDFITVLFVPQKVFSRVRGKNNSPIYLLIMALCAGCLFVGGIFLAGGAVYNNFFEQYSTFLLEQVTSPALFGNLISRYNFPIVFLDALLFFVKAWLFFGFIFWGLLRLMKIKHPYREVLACFSWSVLPFSLIAFLLGVLSLLLKIIVPLFYSNLFFIVLFAIILILVPLRCGTYLEEVNPFRFYLSYYLTCCIWILLWSFNHNDIQTLKFF